MGEEKGGSTAVGDVGAYGGPSDERRASLLRASELGHGGGRLRIPVKPITRSGGKPITCRSEATGDENHESRFPVWVDAAQLCNDRIEAGPDILFGHPASPAAVSRG